MHIIDVFGGEKLPVSFEIFPPKVIFPWKKPARLSAVWCRFRRRLSPLRIQREGRAIPRARSTWRKWRKTNTA